MENKFVGVLFLQEERAFEFYIEFLFHIIYNIPLVENVHLQTTWRQVWVKCTETR